MSPIKLLYLYIDKNISSPNSLLKILAASNSVLMTPIKTAKCAKQTEYLIQYVKEGRDK